MTRFLTATATLLLHAATLAAKEPCDGMLKNWDGDPVHWWVEDGTLIGEVRPATLLKRNTFIIWRGGEVADFELKLEYRVSAEGNSGINDRLSEVPDVKWVNAADPIGPRAIIEGDHKRVIREKKGENSIKLFNLKADPDEKSNLIDQQPELTRKLQNDLRHWQDSMLKSD